VSESELSINYDDLMKEVGDFLGYGPDSTAWSTDETSQCDRYVQGGLRRFYYPSAVEGVEDGYSWSFMHPITTLATVSGTRTQDLPDNLARVLGNFHYETDLYRRSVIPVGEGKYSSLLSRSDDSGLPEVCRIRQKAKQDSEGTRWEVSWWPLPDGAYTLTYQYEAYSGKISVQNPYPLGGMRYGELIVQSCLAVAEQRANDERGMHTHDFERLLRSMVEMDRRTGSRFFGPMGQPRSIHEVPRHGDTGGTYDVIYKGTTH
jgi:hypothetical protein